MPQNGFGAYLSWEFGEAHFRGLRIDRKYISIFFFSQQNVRRNVICLQHSADSNHMSVLTTLLCHEQY